MLKISVNTNTKLPFLLAYLHFNSTLGFDSKEFHQSFKHHDPEKEDIEAVVLSLDFVKCFDKCSFEILHGSLDFFGFGSIVRDWTKILYRNFSVKIQNNGYFSDPISILKGVHQGGCCSSVYFLVVAEILALALRHNDEIEGITIQDIKNLLNQFADDMDIFSMCSKKFYRTNIL